MEGLLKKKLHEKQQADQADFTKSSRLTKQANDRPGKNPPAPKNGSQRQQARGKLDKIPTSRKTAAGSSGPVTGCARAEPLVVVVVVVVVILAVVVVVAAVVAGFLFYLFCWSEKNCCVSNQHSHLLCARGLAW